MIKNNEAFRIRTKEQFKEIEKDKSKHWMWNTFKEKTFYYFYEDSEKPYYISEDKVEQLKLKKNG